MLDIETAIPCKYTPEMSERGIYSNGTTKVLHARGAKEIVIQTARNDRCNEETSSYTRVKGRNIYMYT